MKVFLSVTSLSLGYGGPAASVSRLATALAEAGAQVGIWAPDGSAMSSNLVDASVVRLDGTPAEAIRQFGRPDVLHDNGIWLPHNHQLAVVGHRQGVPRVVSPRGMLEPWARKHKRMKKALAWRLYQKQDLAAAAGLHATGEAEAKNLRALRLAQRVRVIGNGADLPPEVVRPAPGADEAKIALFLGRIYPVKGLPMLIEAWAKVRPQGWKLRIAGPNEAGHRAEVEAAVRLHSLSAVVEFTGPVEGARKRELLLSADLFILPSHSESFGMAIAEALAHGAPVLTTRAAPWPDLEPAAAGWWVETSASGLAEGLEAATALHRDDLRAMGGRGRALIAERYAWPSVADAMLSFYAETVRLAVTP